MKRRLTALLLLLACLLTGCRSVVDPGLSVFAPAEDQRLVIYSSHKAEVCAPVIKEFEERTGIWVELVTGGTGELLERIRSESAAPRCDLMFGGGVESLLSYAECFEPYIAAGAEQLQPGLLPEDAFWTPFSLLPVVLIYNTGLVGEGELKGWADLLEERWRGKIAIADPSVSGSSYTAIMTMLEALPGDDWELLSCFADNLDGKILGDSGDVVSAVSSGGWSIGITLEETALKRRAQGANIGIVYPVEGTSMLPDGAALVAGAAHRENALAFLDFILSEDVQTQVAESFSRRPVRADLPSRAELPAADEIALIDYDLAYASQIKAELLRRWAKQSGGAGA